MKEYTPSGKTPEELAAVQDLEALTGVNIEWEVIKACEEVAEHFS